MNQIYLDYAASAPLRPAVKTAIHKIEAVFGNPNSIHGYGQAALNLTDTARREIAGILGCQPNEIIFTGSATEADNLAIKGIATGRGGGHIITTAMEHKAVLESCRWLEASGFTVTYIKPNRDGLVPVAKIEAAIQPNTILVSIMYANNEIGTIQPIREIGKLIERVNRERINPILFHTDAVQAGASLDLDTKRLHVDLLTLSGHKLGGPKGIGLLFVRNGIQLAPQIHGGGQEQGRRSGTLNISGIVGLATALTQAQKIKARETTRLAALQKYLIGEMRRLPNAEINGSLIHRLPNNLNLSLKGRVSDELVIALDRVGIAVSAASACAAGSIEPSYVLQAMGLSDVRTTSSIRISWGWNTKKADLTALVKRLQKLA